MLDRRFALAPLLALALLGPAPAGATAKTLKRAIENLTQAPLELALAPLTAGVSVVQGLRKTDDSRAVRIAYPLPGYLWNVMVYSGAALLRGVSGALELAPGVVYLGSAKDLDPLFDPVEESASLVDVESDFYRVKLGVDYTTSF